jgi:hypothetical protein
MVGRPLPFAHQDSAGAWQRLHRRLGGRIGSTVAKYTCRQPVESLTTGLESRPFLPCIRDAERQNVAAQRRGWFWRFLQGLVVALLAAGGFDPPREPVDIIICCRAGYGLRHDPPSRYLIARLGSAFTCILDHMQNAAINRLFDPRQRGKLRAVIVPYLGQDDSRLRVGETAGFFDIPQVSDAAFYGFTVRRG